MIFGPKASPDVRNVGNSEVVLTLHAAEIGDTLSPDQWRQMRPVMDGPDNQVRSSSEWNSSVGTC